MSDAKPLGDEAMDVILRGWRHADSGLVSGVPYRTSDGRRPTHRDVAATIDALRAETRAFDDEFVCPECHSYDVRELTNEDDLGSMRCNDCAYAGTPGEDFPTARRVKTEIVELRARADDLQVGAGDRRRLVRALDVAISGEDGAAEQASLCDLVGHAKALRARVAELEKQVGDLCWEAGANNSRVAELEAERDELQQLFDMQHRRTVAAVAEWRERNPGNDLVIPDLGDHFLWVLDRLKEARARVAELEAAPSLDGLIQRGLSPMLGHYAGCGWQAHAMDDSGARLSTEFYKSSDEAVSALLKAAEEAKP